MEGFRRLGSELTNTIKENGIMIVQVTLFKAPRVRKRLQTLNIRSACIGKERQKEGFNVYYTNSRSHRNEIDLLRSTACVENVSIIVIAEIWIAMAGKNL